MNSDRPRATSKAILILTMAAGLIGLFTGIFDQPFNLGAFGIILLAAVFNRLDSRRRAYKASVSTVWGQATLETAGEFDSHAIDA